jgi:valyl-tRNA synthetase
MRAGEADLRAAGRITGDLAIAVADEMGAVDAELVPVPKPGAAPSAN